MNIESGNSGVDKAAVEHMKSLLEDSYTDVLAGYLSDAAVYIEAIAGALKKGDIAGAGEVAHKLKSGSGQFGFLAIEQVAALIEHPEGKSAIALMADHARLKAAYDRSVRFLHAHSLAS